MDNSMNDTNTLSLELVSEVNKKIIEKIENDESRLNVDLNEIKEFSENSLKSRAEGMYIRNYEVCVNSYAKYSLECINNSTDILLQYALNKEDVVEKESNKYIEENKNKIYSNILYYKKIKEYMNILDEDMEYVRLRKLNSIFRNKDLKTLNIKYKQNNKEIEFKIRNKGIFLYNNRDNIDIDRIRFIKDRQSFREEFANTVAGAYIKPKYIEKIMHGTKVLYNFSYKVKKEEVYL